MCQNMYSKWIAHNCINCTDFFLNEYSTVNIAQLRSVKVTVHSGGACSFIWSRAQYSLTAAGRKKRRYHSFRHLGWISLVLKELPRAVMVPCRGWDWLSMREDSFAIILLCPTSFTDSRGYPRTELALLISRSTLFLSAVEMLLPQQTIPKKMADATTES